MVSPTPPALLIIDDDAHCAESMKSALEGEFEVFTAHSVPEAISVLRDEWVQVVFCDQNLRELTGTELLSRVRTEWPETIRVLVSGFVDSTDVMTAIDKAGIHQLLCKPLFPEQLILAARAGVQLFQSLREQDRLRLTLCQMEPGAEGRRQRQRAQIERGYGFEAIIRTPGSPMDSVCALAAQIASFDVPALIEGETGTGKELLARAIHCGSLRSDKPFYAINCGAIPDELLESELFGHRKGAFTGAYTNRVGLLEQANGGTVFLDEIGDTSAAFQVKLLRFLQEGEIRPVGSNETKTVNVRVIAATNRDLLGPPDKLSMERDAFREDLYYRLAVSPLRVPALRERRSDIALLVEHLLTEAMQVHGKAVDGLETDLVDFLLRYDWPGNIRELENEVTRLLILADTDRLSAAHLSSRILTAEGGERCATDPHADAVLSAEGDLRSRVERMEARILRETMTRLRWNKSRAADELGLSRVGLRAKLERYGIEQPDTEQVADKIETSIENTRAALTAAE